MAWIYLIIAGVLEIGWPLGLKIAQGTEQRLLGISIAILFMAASGTLLWLAQREIPIGTAYAVWTGIGAAGTFIVGLMFFGDEANTLKYIGIIAIIGGVALLKLAD